MFGLHRGDPFLTIGMVHFAPLQGREGAPSPDVTLAKARADLTALIEGGIPAVMFENMYDFPQTERVDVDRLAQFRDLLAALTPGLIVPFGLSVLWNDYPTAFALAVEFGASWVRVPVFVDSVETRYGIFRADPAAVLVERSHAHAEYVRIFADIQVKHARMLAPRSIADSARAAEAAGADAIIITGTWTGDPAKLEDVREAYEATSLPILTGSGMTPENIAAYRPSLAGCIVGTALKAPAAHPEEHRLRAPWETPVDPDRVRTFLDAIARMSPS